MIKAPDEEKVKEKNEVFLEEIEKHSRFDIPQKNLYEIERKLNIKVSIHQAILHI